jgi:hypothetical protein
MILERSWLEGNEFYNLEYFIRNMRVSVKHYSRLIVAGFLFISVVSSCRNKTLSFPEIDEPLLFQGYEIQTQNNQTKVNASVFFQETLDGKNSPKYLPNKVAVNNQPMKQEKLESFVLSSSAKVVQNQDYQFVRANSDSDFDGFSGLLPSKENYFKFEVADKNNKVRTFELLFEPFEFEDSNSIKLSRSKETVIKIRGQNGENKRLSIFGLDDSTESSKSLEDIEVKDNSIKISPELVKGIDKNNIELSIFTIEHNYIDQLASRNGSKFIVGYTGHYMISNLSKTEVEIVD